MSSTSKEEKSRLRGVRLDCLGGELRGFDLVPFFLGDGAFHILVRDGNGQWRPGVGAGIGEAAVDIFRGIRRQLVAVSRGECHLHVGDGDGLVAVVGHDEEDGQESMLVKVYGENLRFVGGVVGVSCDGNLLVGVLVMRGIGFRGLGYGLHEVLGARQSANAATAHKTTVPRRSAVRERCFHERCMLPIIEANPVPFCRRSLFRMTGLDHFSLQLPLQRGTGGGDVGKPAVLAFPDGAPWQVPQGASRRG